MKSVTARAFLIAQSEGRADLHKPVNAEKKILPLKDESVSKRLSIADVLLHRVGLPPHDCLWYLGPGSSKDLARKVQLLDSIPDGFRKTFIYSNLMYSTLAPLFNELTGQDFESWVTSKIFKPLKMESTSMHSPSADQVDVALPYFGAEKIALKDLKAVVSGGGLRSNLDDLTKWLSFNLRPENIEAHPATNELIPLENPSPLQFQGLYWLSEAVVYGYGWFIGKAFGETVFFHPGFIDGYSSIMVMLPVHNVGMTVLANESFSSFPGLLVQQLIADLVGKKVPETAVAVAPPAPPQVVAAPQAISGFYESQSYGTVQISEGKEGAVLKYNGHEWLLNFIGPDTALFSVIALGIPIPLPAQLVRKNGKVESVSIPFSFDPRVAAECFTRV